MKFKKLLATGMVSVATLGGLTAYSNVQNNVDLKTTTLAKEVDINLEGTQNKVGSLYLSNEVISHNSYSVDTQVSLNEPYSFNTANEDEEYFDTNISVFDNEGNILYEDFSNFDTGKNEHGWMSSYGYVNIGGGAGSDVVLKSNETYNWVYTFNLVNEDGTSFIAKTSPIEFTTTDGNDNFKPFIITNLNDTSVSLKYKGVQFSQADLNNPDYAWWNPLVNLSGTSIDPSLSNFTPVRELTTNKIIINNLNSNTTYSDWKLGVKDENPGLSKHTQYITLPTFTTLNSEENLNKEVLDAVDTASIVVPKFSVYPNKTTYKYKVTLNESLVNKVDAITITTSAQEGTKEVESHSSQVVGNKLVYGSTIEWTNYISNSVENLSTTITINYKGYSTPTTLELSEDSPFKSFTRTDAVNGKLVVDNTPTVSEDTGRTTQEKLDIAVSSLGIISEVFIMFAITLLLIKMYKKDTDKEDKEDKEDII